MRHGSASSDSGYVRHGRVGAQVQKYVVASDDPRTTAGERDFDCSRCDKPSFPHHQFSPAGLVLVEVNLYQILDHFSLVPLHPHHVYSKLTNLKTKFSTSPHQ